MSRRRIGESANYRKADPGIEADRSSKRACTSRWEAAPVDGAVSYGPATAAAVGASAGGRFTFIRNTSLVTTASTRAENR